MQCIDNLKFRTEVSQNSILQRTARPRGRPGSREAERMAGETPRTQDPKRHARISYLTEPRRALAKVHREMATESLPLAFRLAERDAFRPEPTREAEAAPAPREVEYPALRPARLQTLRGVDDGPAEHAAETAAATTGTQRC